jgi:hypothetical protein
LLSNSTCAGTQRERSAHGTEVAALRAAVEDARRRAREEVGAEMEEEMKATVAAAMERREAGAYTRPLLS